MKRKILSSVLVLILTLTLFILTGCGESNEVINESLNEETEQTSEEDTSIDYTMYTDDLVSKIIETSTYYYAIEDLNNDGIPELLTKTGDEDTNSRFTVYKFVNSILEQVTYESNAINFDGITELSKKEYEDGSIRYVIDEYETTRISNGGYIDLAYIQDNMYIEYSKTVGSDLDTLSSSEISKFVLNLDTYEVSKTNYEYEIDSSATSMDKAVISSKYNADLENAEQELEQNLKATEKVIFYQSSFSEWEHDDTELTQDVQNILEQLNK